MLLLLASMLMSPAHAVDIPHETFTLENGMQVMLIEDRRLPKVVVNIWYDVGSYDDPTGKSGFAHLFEHLMFKGSDRVAEGEFDSSMEAAGGWNNAWTDDFATSYYDVGPSSSLDLLLWLEADRMTSLQITDKKLGVEREVVRNEKRQNYEDPPYADMWIELPPALYGADNPLRRPGIGNHEELMASTVDDVTTFYNTWYVPSNAVLTVAGDFDTAELKGKITALFGTLESKPRPARELVAMPTQPVQSLVEITDDVTLPRTLLVWHGPAAFKAGDAERDVLSALLTGSEDSRLIKRLVHEERLCQSVEAWQGSHRWESQFMIDAMLAPGADLARVETIIDEELTALSGERPPTEVEVQRALANLEFGLLQGLETLESRAAALQRYRMFTGRSDYLSEDLARYRKVDVAAVQVEAAKLTADSRVRIQVTPEAE
ncbi:MAG: zinc protease [Kiritimatiellia bacterium]|jgi:zinc protease